MLLFLEMGYDLEKSMKDGIEQSKVVIACVNRKYETRPNCMFELNHACGPDPKAARKIIIGLVCDDISNVFKDDSAKAADLWDPSKEMREILNFRKKMYCDVSSIASSSLWEEDMDHCESVDTIPNMEKSLEQKIEELNKLTIKESDTSKITEEISQLENNLKKMTDALAKKDKMKALEKILQEKTEELVKLLYHEHVRCFPSMPASLTQRHRKKEDQKS